MRAGQWWPVALAGVLGVTVVANVFLLYAANDRNAAVVEPDYYRKAVAWDSSSAQAGANAALAWQIDASIEPLDAGGNGMIRVRAMDRDGEPLAGAAVVCIAIHNRDAARRPQAETLLDEAGAGGLGLPLRWPGMWELRLSVTRGAERFTVVLRRDAAYAPDRREG